MDSGHCPIAPPPALGPVRSDVMSCACGRGSRPLPDSNRRPLPSNGGQPFALVTCFDGVMARALGHALGASRGSRRAWVGGVGEPLDRTVAAILTGGARRDLR